MCLIILNKTKIFFYKLFKVKILIAFLTLIFFFNNAHAEYQGRYCEMDGAYTESGKIVYGEFFMYSENYGEADGAYTEDNEYVYGECYRYSGNYCEMDGVYTDSGEAVTGGCYIY